MEKYFDNNQPVEGKDLFNLSLEATMHCKEWWPSERPTPRIVCRWTDFSASVMKHHDLQMRFSWCVCLLLLLLLWMTVSE